MLRTEVPRHLPRQQMHSTVPRLTPAVSPVSPAGHTAHDGCQTWSGRPLEIIFVSTRCLTYPKLCLVTPGRTSLRSGLRSTRRQHVVPEVVWRAIAEVATEIPLAKIRLSPRRASGKGSALARCKETLQPCTSHRRWQQGVILGHIVLSGLRRATLVTAPIYHGCSCIAPPLVAVIPLHMPHAT